MSKSALIIDDHAVNRIVLEKFFTRLNFTTAEAQDIPTAIRKYQSTAFSIVALDLHMPKLNGFDFLEFVNAEAAKSGAPIPPIFVITGDATVRAKDLRERCPATRLFFKPVDLQELRAALSEIALA